MRMWQLTLAVALLFFASSICDAQAMQWQCGASVNVGSEGAVPVDDKRPSWAPHQLQSPDAVDRLSAEVAVRRLGSGLFRVEGAWQAEVQQACVVTLEPVADSLSGNFEASFEAAEGPSRAAEDEIVVDPEAADPAEILPEEGIDLGELVVQELAVALNPYPRASGAEVPARYRPPEDDEVEGPFAALRALKGDK